MPVCEKCLFIFRQKAIASGKENIWDPALRILGYPAGRISGKISIRCITGESYQYRYLFYRFYSSFGNGANLQPLHWYPRNAFLTKKNLPGFRKPF